MLFPSGPKLSDDLLDNFFANPFQFLTQCQENYGDIFSVPLGDFGAKQYQTTGNWVFLTNPEHIKQLFSIKDHAAVGGEANDIQFMQLMPARGSVVIDGQEHMDRRRALSDVVVGKQRLQRFTPMMLEIAMQVFQQAAINNGTVHLASVFRTLSNQIMEKAAFGNACDSLTAAISSQLNRFGDLGVTPEDKQGLLGQCLSDVYTFLSEKTKCPFDIKTSDQETYISLLDGLMHCSDNQQALSQAQIRDELVTMLLGGADTTATSISWVMAWLLKHPHTLQLLQQEISNAVRETPLLALDIEQLPYLDAVVKESARISPMLFNSSLRLLKQPLQIDQYQLPVGTIVANSTYLVHQCKEVYPDPQRFNPERFLGRKPAPYHWIPFGGGIRRCIGMGFALHEIKLVLASLLLDYHIEDMGVNIQAEMQGSFFGPKGGVPVKLFRK